MVTHFARCRALMQRRLRPPIPGAAVLPAAALVLATGMAACSPVGTVVGGVASGAAAAVEGAADIGAATVRGVGNVGSSAVDAVTGSDDDDDD